jgi:hypothetical protein
MVHPVQERIAKSHGSQCGFCTPGIVMSMYALLRSKSNLNMNDINIAFQGNWFPDTSSIRRFSIVVIKYVIKLITDNFSNMILKNILLYISIIFIIEFNLPFI